MTFGEYFAQLRRERGFTLRGFCQENEIDPGNLSKVERGRTQPPKPERLARYAHALGLAEGSEEWATLFDLAYVGRGVIPPEILGDEELAHKLPVLFRTLRGEPVDEERVRTLAERVRRA